MIKRLVSFLALFVSLVVGLLAHTVVAQPIGVISVAGNNFIADGRPWVPRGVNVAGLLAPRPLPYTKFVAASTHWGPAEIAAIKAYGADVVRFLVSQPGLDPQSPLYTPTYLSRISATVRAVRSAGLAVILCMQWEKTSGMTGLSSMPDGSTLRAWQALAPIFARDAGVVYELFNEPVARGERPPQAWATWTTVFQKLINDMRRITTNNVIIVDGMRRRIHPAAADSLSDPAGHLAFAVHPYPRDRVNNPEAWDRRFGNVALSHPVILTEWNSTSRWACLPNTPEMVQQLLEYLRQRRIGIVGWVFDIPGSLVKDFSFAPTNYVDFRCSPTGDNGAGEALRQHFRIQSTQ